MKPSLKTQLVTFTLLTLGLSWAAEAYLIATDGVRNLGLIGLVALMWIPGAVALIYRLIARIGFGDLGLKLGRLKFYLGAIALPLGLALLTNLLALPLGLRSFAPMPLDELQMRAGVIFGALAIGLFGALGEELGWRGFLLPKMIEAGVGRPYLLSSVIWALWHVPLVSLGNYYQIDSPILIALVYSFSIIAIGTVIGHFRMRSGSVWVATVFHASHNFVFQLALPFLVFSGTGPNGKWWELVGADCGVIVGGLYLMGFFLIRRRS